MGEHKEILYSVLPIIAVIIAVTLHLVYGDICDEGNIPQLEIFQQTVVKNASELCIITITPTLFKWIRHPDSFGQVEYNVRSANKPDLPSWLQFTYDEKRSEGFLYGVPPLDIGSINLHVIARNRDDEHNTKKLIISLDINEPSPSAQLQSSSLNTPAFNEIGPYNSYYDFIVELKIDNMNVKDLCKPRRMERIIDLFTRHLNWNKLNGEPVRPVYLASAIEIGENHIPIRPTESEGVILHLGSDRNFSTEMFKLRSEVLPLWKIRPCPRDVKRTSMERFFRNENILLDWCSFTLVYPSDTTSNDLSDLEDDSVASSDGIRNKKEQDDSVFYFKSEMPEKSYGVGIALATIIPGTIGSVLGFLLLLLFLQDREEDSPVDGDSLFFEAAFRFLISLCRCRSRISDGEFDNNNPILGSHSHQPHRLYKSPTGDDDVVLITRDCYAEPPPQVLNDGSVVVGGRERTPMPPQYGETHPNGSPALIYAV